MSCAPSSPRRITPRFGGSCTRRAASGGNQKNRDRWHILVGHHRVQLAMQELPAIVGQHGREYKISLIHLRTRLKYSEIYPNQRSGTIASVLERAVLRLPPFHLVVTTNAMMFTLAYTAHPERVTAFERMIVHLGLRYWRIPCGAPWRNGFIKRSNRTDNDECFHRQRFSSAEERRYVHRLWEMTYNTRRPR